MWESVPKSPPPSHVFRKSRLLVSEPRNTKFHKTGVRPEKGRLGPRVGDHGSEHVPEERDSPCMLIKAIGLEKARHMRCGPSLDCVNVHGGAVSFVILSSVAWSGSWVVRLRADSRVKSSSTLCLERFHVGK